MSSKWVGSYVAQPLTRTMGSIVIPSKTLCILSPTSRGLFGIAGPRDLKKPFGEYVGIFEKSRNYKSSNVSLFFMKFQGLKWMMRYSWDGGAGEEDNI